MSTGTTDSGSTTIGEDERLMRYFDGELPLREMDALRADLDADPDLQARLDGLGHLRDLMVCSMEDVGADLDADAMFAAVLARSDAEADVADDDPMFPPTELPAASAPVEPGRVGLSSADAPVLAPVADDAPARPPLRVLEGGRSEGAAPRGAAAGADLADDAHRGEPLRAAVARAEPVPAEVVHEAKPRAGLWFGAVGALAVAAAVLFFVLRPSPGERGGSERPLAAAPAGSEIEDVDFGYSTGSVFTVEDPDADAQYAVVWISDEEVADEAPEGSAPEGSAPEGSAPEGSAPDVAAPNGPSGDQGPSVEGTEGP